ncbi:MAG: hypothetical protein AAF915_23900 [Cyanobacteria bacterium P01_D01_bin.50]
MRNGKEIGASGKSSANISGLESLRESKQDFIALILQNYSEIMNVALEKKTYKVEHHMNSRKAYFDSATPVFSKLHTAMQLKFVLLFLKIKLNLINTNLKHML